MSRGLPCDVNPQGMSPPIIALLMNALKVLTLAAYNKKTSSEESTCKLLMDNTTLPHHLVCLDYILQY